MKLDLRTTLLFGALAGMCAEVVTYPLEVIRRKMQLERVLASRKAHLAITNVSSSGGARVVRATRLRLLFCSPQSACWRPHAELLQDAATL